MVQKVNFNNLTGDTLTIGNTTISGTGVTVDGDSLGTGVTVYANASVLPTSGLTSGTLAYTGNAIFITNGSGWYRVAVTNQDPSLSITQDSLSFTGNTGAVLDFNYTVSDPDGTTPTVTLSNSGFANTSVATIQHFTGNNTVRITNLSNTTYTGSITLTASDGISTGFDSANAIFTATLSISTFWKNAYLSLGTSSTNSLDNSTFIDRSTNSLTATTTGTPFQTAFHPYLDNYSINFEGYTERVYTGSSSDFGIGTNDFSYEGWIYVNNSSDLTTYSRGFGLGANYAGNDTACVVLRDAAQSSYITFTLVSTRVLVSSQLFEFGQWNHIAVCRSGSTLSMFYNGTRIATASNSDDINSGNATYAYICHTGSNSEGFDGKASNVRFLNGSSAYDATQTSITVPTEKLTAITNTKLLTAQSNRFVDNSSSGHTLTLGNTPEIHSFNPFGQLSNYDVAENKGSVDLNGDYLTLSSSDVGSFGTGDYTVEFWIYKRGTTNDCIIDLRGGDFSHGVSVEMDTQVTVFYGGSPFQDTGSFDNFAWNHIAISRSSGTLKGFINGSQIFSVSDTNDRNSTSYTSKVGVNYGNAQPTDALLSDLRVIHSAIYTSAFTPPTSPVGSTNAKLYLPFDNAGVFDKTAVTTLQVPTEAAQGAPTTDTSIKKFASSSLNFGGTSDDKLWQVDLVPPLGAGPFTIEGWIYPTSATGTWQSVVTRDYGATGGWRLYKTATTAGFTWYRGSTSTYSTGACLTNNTWHHFAVCRDSSDDLRIFVDGTQQGTTVSNSYDYTAYDPDNPVNIGSGGKGDSSAYPFAGNMEGIQILVGVAKYTANFTAPTAEQNLGNQVSS